jgi:putative hydrolase of the HAD superfamily
MSDFYSAIEKKHQQLQNQGINFPEVEIDRIWMEVLQLDDKETARDFATEFELIVNPVYPMPHLKDLIWACNHRNMRMGIISNAQFFTPYLFNWFLDAEPADLGFDKELLFYSYRFGYGKPSTYLFQKAIEKLDEKGISSPAILYVGNDMLNDIYPAHQVGFQTVLFAGDKRSLRLREDDPRCRDIRPDLVITDLSQLVDQLKILD